MREVHYLKHSKWASQQHLLIIRGASNHQELVQIKKALQHISTTESLNIIASIYISLRIVFLSLIGQFASHAKLT